jgi:microsomal dipeptidase-like Zn-dependent dipeptidase
MGGRENAAPDAHPSGYFAARIEKIVGQNFLRYAREVWGA